MVKAAFETIDLELHSGTHPRPGFVTSSKHKLSQVSVQEGPTSSAEIESEAVELINEDDLEVTDFDVEREHSMVNI
ncbi:hypothetical protein ACS0TY_011312 [Phlomoides rotata]